MDDWVQWVTAIIGVLGGGTALATYIKTRPAMKMAETEGQKAIKALQMQGEDALWARIAALEQKLETADDECDKRIDRMTERHESAMAEMKAEIRILRHDRNNVQAGFKAMLAMIKRLDHPDLGNIAAAVEDMVARGEQTIAIEKAAAPGKGC